MKYRSVATPKFWEAYDRLPSHIQTRAKKQFELFSADPLHRSLHLKRVGDLWSVRISKAYRALATRNGDEFAWVWIGTHDEYDRLLD